LTIKNKVIAELQKIPNEKMVLVHQFVSQMNQTNDLPAKRDMAAVRRLRKALSSCTGSLSADIIAARAERI
jgi:hypothetical protein